MSMMDLTDFFYMQGRGIYVWPAYGVALGVLVWNIVIPLVRRKKLEQSIRYRYLQKLESSPGQVTHSENVEQENQ